MPGDRNKQERHKGHGLLVGSTLLSSRGRRICVLSATRVTISPGGTEANSQGREPLDLSANGHLSPNGAAPPPCRPSGACEARCHVPQGLTPRAIDWRRVAA